MARLLLYRELQKVLLFKETRTRKHYHCDSGSENHVLPLLSASQLLTGTFSNQRSVVQQWLLDGTELQ